MAVKKIITCDRCERVIVDPPPNATPSIEKYDMYLDSQALNLCRDCIQGAWDYINEIREQQVSTSKGRRRA